MELDVGSSGWTSSVWEDWKDLRVSCWGLAALVVGEGVVVEELLSSSITRFSMGLGRSLASGPLPCTKSRSMGS